MENQAITPEADSALSPRGLAPVSGSDRFRLFLHAVSFVLLATFLVSMIALGVKPLGQRLSPTAARVLIYLLADAGLLLLSWLFLAALDRRPGRSLGLWFYPAWTRESLVGMGLGAGLVALVAGAMYAGGLLHYASRLSPTGLGFSGGVAFLLVAAAFEEIAFRGYAFQRLVEGFGPAAVVLLSSALFGLSHLHNPWSTPLSIVNTMLAGVLMAVGYLRSRGLWLPIGLHFAWNFTLGPLFSLPVSGMRPAAYLFEAQVTGPIWLTGGEYGPEGSILLTVACISAIVWLARTPAIVPSAAMREVVR
jgi:membrane protease YdiL (CAAX protease family)